MQRELQRELSAWERLRDEILTLYPDLDEETLYDTLEGETDLREACLKVLRSAEDDNMLIEGIKARKAELDERKARFERRIDAKRTAVANIMDRTGIERIEGADMTVSTRYVPPKVIVEAPELLPREVCPTEWVYKPDKKAIRKLMGDLTQIPGARLTNGSMSITVRTK